MSQNPEHVNTKLDYGHIIDDPVGTFTGNCENIIGFTPVPLGLAGPTKFDLNGKTIEAQLPMATTEACLVASVNRGFKALRLCPQSPKITVKEVGITRSAAFLVPDDFDFAAFKDQINADKDLLNDLIRTQSRFTNLEHFDLEYRINILFINFYYKTGQAMGMNMATIATKHLADAYFKAEHDLELITVSANWCGDKKPTAQSQTKGRKFMVTAEAVIPADVVVSVLKTNSEKIALVDDVKLRQGSELAGSIGSNAHHANIVAASFMALGQDLAHTVDGSLGSSYFEITNDHDLKVKIEIPALVCGTIGGGTSLPVQQQTLALTQLKKNEDGHYESKELAALIGSGVLAGEISLMAALSSHTLAESHQKLRRDIS